MAIRRTVESRKRKRHFHSDNVQENRQTAIRHEIPSGSSSPHDTGRSLQALQDAITKLKEAGQELTNWTAVLQHWVDLEASAKVMSASQLELRYIL
jgi:hypothetical protein